MTLTLVGASNVVSFVATTASTTYSLTTAGKTLPNITVNTGSTTTIQFADAVTAPNVTITLTAGKLDTNGQTVTTAVFSSTNTNTRTLTLGASSISLTAGSTAWNTSTVTGLTMTANTATVTLSGGASIFSTGAKDYNGMSVVLSGSGNCQVGSGAMTVANFTRTGTASKTDLLTITGSFTVTSAFTVNSNSSINRVQVLSSAVGTVRTITAGSLTCTNIVDWQDITGAGAATWTTGASGATAFGDCGGNSGITFTTPATQTATGTASFTWSTHGWTSRVPLPQDDVIINNAFVSGRTITGDMPRLGKNIDFTGMTGSPTVNVSSTTSNSIFGSLTLISAMTWNPSSAFNCSGRGSYTITTAGKTMTANIAISAPGGTYTLQDAFVSSGNSSTLATSFGTLDTNNQSITTTNGGGAIAVSNTAQMITGTSSFSMAYTSSSNFWSVVSTATVDAANATITLTAPSSNTRVFSGKSASNSTYSYGTFIYTVANSPGRLDITGAAFSILSIGSGRLVTYSGIGTIDNFIGAGVVNPYIYLPGTSGNFITTPDAAANQITGDITIDIKVAMTSWTPLTSSAFLAKYNTATTRSYSFGVNTDGTLWFIYSLNGSTAITVNSSVATGFSAGTTNWVRATRVAATGVVKFWTSSDGSSWTQLGTDQSGTSGNLSNQFVFLEIGSTTLGSATLAVGNFYIAKLYNSDLGSSSGTPVQSFDASAKAVLANTYTSGTGEVWTLNSLAQQGDGRISLKSNNAGTSRTITVNNGMSIPYAEVKDIAATPSNQFYVLDGVNVSGNTGIVFEPQNMRHPELNNAQIAALAGGIATPPATIRASAW